MYQFLLVNFQLEQSQDPLKANIGNIKTNVLAAADGNTLALANFEKCVDNICLI